MINEECDIQAGDRVIYSGREWIIKHIHYQGNAFQESVIEISPFGEEKPTISEEKVNFLVPFILIQGYIYRSIG